MGNCREVAFVDRGVDELEVLLAGLRPDVDRVVLSSREPALAQMVRALAGRSDLAALHLIAHGRPGEVAFAAGALGVDDLAEARAELALIGRALATDGRVLLWSCETGADAEGRAFVDGLAEALDTEVLAASHRVGHPAMGGAWRLDQTSERPPLTPAGQAAYAGVLVIADITGITTDSGSLNNDGVTNDATLSLSITASRATTYNVLVDGSVVGTVTLSGGTPATTAAATYSLPSALTQGGHTLGIAATADPGVVLDSFAVTIDTTAPSVPTLSGISTDTGSSGADRITSDNTLVLSGAAEARSTVQLFRNGVSVGTAVADGSGAWTLDQTATPLADGSYIYSARATDLAGNASALSAGVTVKVDTTAAAPAVRLTTDSGLSNADRITNVAALTVTPETGAVVEYSADGLTGWSGVAPAASQGSNTVFVRQTDVAGNVSAATSFTYTFDTVAPGAASVTGITTDTGVSGSDGVTNDPTLVVSGAAEAGSRVQVFRNGLSIGTVTADGAGAWSLDSTATTLAAGTYTFTARATDTAGNGGATSPGFTVKVDTAAAAPVVALLTDSGASPTDRISNVATLKVTPEAGAVVEYSADGASGWSTAAPTVAQGLNTVFVRQTDPAGNISTATSFTFTFDNVAPGTATVAGISSDRGASGSDGVTSDRTLVISGTAEAGSTVQVFRNGASIGTTTANGSGAWSFDSSATTLAAGTYTYTARATDTAGNVGATSAGLVAVVDFTANAPTVTLATDTGSSATDKITNVATLNVVAETGAVVEYSPNGTGGWSTSAPAPAQGANTVFVRQTDLAGNVSANATFTFTFDSAAPAAPTVTGVSTDTGSSTTDGVTNDKTLAINGTAEANAVVHVFKDGVAIGSAAANASGVWSLNHTATTLGDGAYTFTARATDAAGNVGATSSGFVATVDSLAPAAPSITRISSDTGTSTTDGVTSDKTLVIGGTAEAGASVQVLRNGLAIGTITASGSGAWSFDSTATTLADGTYTFTARATDAAGNLGAVSTGYSVKVDSVAAAPTVALASDTGASATDKITNASALNVTSEAGAFVEYSTNGVDGWSTTAPTPSQGANTVFVRQTDLAGNTSASTSFTFTLDTVAPGVVAVTNITTDSGSSATDGVTNDKTLVIGGTSDAGALVQVFKGGVSIGTATANGSGVWSLSHTGTTLADGAYTFTARASDVAGNLGPTSDGFAVTVDSVAAAPVVSLAVDSGSSATDKVTNVAALAVTAEPGAVVQYSLNGTTGFTTTAPTPVQGANTVFVRQVDLAGNISANTSFTFTFDTVAPTAPVVALATDSGSSGSDRITNVATLNVTPATGAAIEYSSDGLTGWSATAPTATQGVNNVFVRQTDLAGNASGLTVFSFTFDTAGPSASVTRISADTGVSALDGVTGDNTLVVSGVTEAGAGVEVFKGGVSIGTTTADGSGAWSLDHTGVALADGTYAFSVRATDAAGNMGAVSAPFTVTVDNTPPAAPSVALAADTGASGADKVTSNATLIVASEAGATVEYSPNGISAWSAAAPTPSQGLNTVFVRQTDLLGNASPVTAFSFTFDTAPPATPGVALASDSGASSTDGITNVATLTVTPEAGALVEYSADGVSGWSVSAPAAAQGANTVFVRQTDLAGNVSASTGFSFTYDTGGPVSAITGLSTDTGALGDRITSDRTLAFTGGTDAGGTVQVFKDGVSIGTATANGAGVWAFDYSGTTLADGAYVFTARATDLAGNLGAISLNYAVTVDGTAPGAPTVGAVALDSLLHVSGTAEANSTVRILRNGVQVGVATANGAGAWSLNAAPSGFGPGAYAFTAQAVDVAGNVSAASAATNLTIAAPPDEPEIVLPDPVPPPPPAPEPDGPVVIIILPPPGSIQGPGFLMEGGAGADSLIGAAGDDRIFGGGGDDHIEGAGGSNYLRGGEGDDVVVGGAGFDDAHGNQGNDTLSGGDGDDWVVGGKDQDRLSGDSGNDLVYGNLGDDTCLGGDGADIVRGGQGNDVVLGGAGDDWLSGDRGSDTLTGGAGADIFHTFSEAGLDRVLDFRFAEGDRVQVDPGTLYVLRQVGEDTVIDMGSGNQMVLVGVQLSTLPDAWIFAA